MNKRIIAVVHNAPVRSGHSFSKASLNVLAQMENIENALVELGHPTVRIPFTRDIGAFIQKMKEEKVEMAFNLCETVNENPQLAGHSAAVLELLGIPFSGSPSISLMLTADKVMLIAKGIRTPAYLIYNGTEKFNVQVLSFPVTVRPRFESACIGIDQDFIFQDEGEFKKGIRAFFDRFGTMLVEEYIAGREFDISFFGYPSASLLPVAEIDFPNGLLKSMESTALESFRLLMLRDYGRVDMRFDGSGRIQVLDVDPNPCLSADAGFAAAAQKAGIGYIDLVSGMVGFMLQRTNEDDNKAPMVLQER
jgi:D-alanine-D-alanine ligase